MTSRLPAAFEDDDDKPLGPLGRSSEEAGSRATAEIQAAYVMAMRYPRNVEQARADVDEAFRRADVAEDATYSYQRGGTDIEGPSVALARECARAWGHIRSGFRIVDSDEKYVHIVGFALDVQRNIYDESEDRFERAQQRKDKRSGKTFWVIPDERDMREILNKRGAIAQRNALLKVLPSWLTSTAFTLAKQTQRGAKSGPGDLDKSRAKAVAAFDAEGITQAQLEQRVGRPLAQWTADDVAALRKLFVGLSEGHLDIDQEFPRSQDAGGAEPQQGAQDAQGDQDQSGDEQQDQAQGDDVDAKPKSVADITAGAKKTRKSKGAKDAPPPSEKPKPTDAERRQKTLEELQQLTHGASEQLNQFVRGFLADAGAARITALPLDAEVGADGFDPSLTGLLRDVKDLLSRG